MGFNEPDSVEQIGKNRKLRMVFQWHYKSADKLKRGVNEVVDKLVVDLLKMVQIADEIEEKITKEQDTVIFG